MLNRLYVILAGDPFAGFRAQLGGVLLALFGLVLMITLGVTVVNVIQGERESAKKMLKWVVVSAVGTMMIQILREV